MSVCPNCGATLEEGVDYCQGCGNPLGEERPWEKTNKPKSDATGAFTPERGPKVKHQERQSGKRERYLSTMEKEWYLEKEFVIKIGYCGFSANPEEPEKLKDGTAVLTKRALIFGESEHNIRCGKYSIEIPVEVIDYVTDAAYKGKPAFLIQVNSGEQIIMFVMKKKEWIEYFEYVTTYRPSAVDNVAEEETEVKAGTSPLKRWGMALLYALGAAFFFFWSYFREGIFHYFLIAVGCLILILLGFAIFDPEKLRR